MKEVFEKVDYRIPQNMHQTHVNEKEMEKVPTKTRVALFLYNETEITCRTQKGHSSLNTGKQTCQTNWRILIINSKYMKLKEKKRAISEVREKPK